MAQGENAERWGHAGKEHWKSRLRRHGDELGKYVKKLTHKKERRENKKATEQELKDAL